MGGVAAAAADVPVHADMQSVRGGCADHLWRIPRHLAGVGQTAAGALGAAGQNYASNVGNLGVQQGYTAGNALLAGAQARQSAYGGIGQALGQISPQQWSSAGNAISGLFGGGGGSDFTNAMKSAVSGGWTYPG